jgi:hypothetical protein
MLSESEIQTLEAGYRRSFVLRRRNAVLTALACAAVGGAVTYLASSSALLAIPIGIVAVVATGVLTLGVYILFEPVSEDFEEYAEIMHLAKQDRSGN